MFEPGQRISGGPDHMVTQEKDNVMKNESQDSHMTLKDDGSYTNPLGKSTILASEVMDMDTKDMDKDNPSPPIPAKDLSEVIQIKSMSETEEQAKHDLKPQPLGRQLWGLGLVLLMNLFSGIIFVCVKVLKDEHHPVAQTFWMQVVTLFCAMGTITCLHHGQGQGQGQDPPPESAPTPTLLQLYLGLSKDWRTSSEIWTVALLFGFSNVFKIWSLLYLTLGDATSTGYLSIFTSMIFGHFILEDEPLRLFPFLAGLTILFGVVVIARPPFIFGGTMLDSGTLAGIGLTILFSITAGLYFVLHRRLKTIHFTVLNSSQAVAAIFMASGSALALGVLTGPKTPREIGFLIGMGLLSYASQIFRIAAVKVEKAYLISLYRPTDIVIATGLQIIFLGQTPNLTSGLGSVLILICVVLMVVRKIISEQPKESWSRRWLGCLMY